MSDDETVADETVAEGAETETPDIARSHGVPVTEGIDGMPVLHVTPAQLIETAEAVRADGFAQLLDLCGVDYLTHPGGVDLPDVVVGERFEVVVGVIDHTNRRRLRLRVHVPESDPFVPTLFDVWPGSEILERETFDMFGIIFTDHPDLSRLLMPEDWVGYPLRKDYAIGEIPVQFKGAPTAR